MNQPDSLSMTVPNRIIQRISLRFGGSNPKELERFLKFAVVGAIGAVIDLGITNILLFLFHPQPDDLAPVQIATGVGFITAVISNFIWNRYWTYPESRTRPMAPQLAQFFIVNAVGLLIREIVVTLTKAPFTNLIHGLAGASLSIDLQTKLGANMSIILALVIVMLWNFFVNRRWTYSHVK